MLTADFHTLVDVYKRFLALGIPEKVPSRMTPVAMVKNPDLQDLEKIFNYTKGFDGEIADFIVKWSEKLELRSCYYCEMAYVNSYSVLEKKGGSVAKKRQFDLDHFLPKEARRQRTSCRKQNVLAWDCRCITLFHLVRCVIRALSRKICRM